MHLNHLFNSTKVHLLPIFTAFRIELLKMKKVTDLVDNCSDQSYSLEAKEFTQVFADLPADLSVRQAGFRRSQLANNLLILSV